MFALPLSGFNAAMVERPYGYFAVDRWGFRKPRWGLQWTRMSSTFQPISGTERIFPGVDKVEDARLIKGRYPDEILMFATTSQGMSLCAIHDEEGSAPEFGPLIFLRTDFPRQPAEKNWVPFWHDGHLYLIYSIFPHLVLRCNLDTGDCTRAYISAATDMEWPWGEMRGGCPPLLMGDTYVSIFHSMIYTRDYQKIRPAFDSLREDDKQYFVGAYLFDSKPPFAIAAVTGIHLNRWMPPSPEDIGHFVLFPQACFRDGEDLKIVMGVNDRRSMVVPLPWARVRDNLVPVSTATAPYGEVYG